MFLDLLSFSILPWGKNLAWRMARGQVGGEAQFSKPRGRGCLPDPRPRAPCRRVYAPAPKPPDISAASQGSALIHFLHSFAAVAAVAEALKFTLREFQHIAMVWLDVVDIGRANSPTQLCTLPAERFTHQLVGAAFRPAVAGIRVQVMPSGRLLPACPWLMLWAVALVGKHPTAGMLTPSQRFLHGSLLSGKTKRPESKHHNCDDGSGLFRQWLKWNIHNDLPLAGLTPDGKIFDFGIW